MLTNVIVFCEAVDAMRAKANCSFSKRIHRFPSFNRTNQYLPDQFGNYGFYAPSIYSSVGNFQLSHVTVRRDALSNRYYNHHRS